MMITLVNGFDGLLCCYLLSSVLFYIENIILGITKFLDFVHRPVF
jgi:hypothetical protein